MYFLWIVLVPAMWHQCLQVAFGERGNSKNAFTVDRAEHYRNATPVRANFARRRRAVVYATPKRWRDHQPLGAGGTPMVWRWTAAIRLLLRATHI